MKVLMQIGDGRIVDPENPKMDDIYYPHIARSLSRIVRFGGHSEKVFTVGMHVLLLHHLIGEILRDDHFAQTDKTYLLRQALHHDDTEGFMGFDCPYPIKKLIPGISEYEKKLWESVFAPLYDLPNDCDPLVKALDKIFWQIETFILDNPQKGRIQDALAGFILNFMRDMGITPTITIKPIPVYWEYTPEMVCTELCRLHAHYLRG